MDKDAPLNHLLQSGIFSFDICNFFFCHGEIERNEQKRLCQKKRVLYQLEDYISLKSIYLACLLTTIMTRTMTTADAPNINFFFRV